MSLKDLGSLFSGFGEISLGTFKGFSSIEEMPNVLQNAFKGTETISGAFSNLTTEQIKAKAAVMGLSESLTGQAVLLATDAAATATAIPAKMMLKEAVTSLSVAQIAEAASNTSGLDNKLADTIATTAQSVASGKLTEARGLQALMTEAASAGEVELATAGIAAGAGQTAAAAGTTTLGTALKGLWATITPLLPAIAIIGSGLALAGLTDVLTVDYGEARENSDSSSGKYQDTKTELESINSELEKTRARMSELQSKGTLTLTESAELEKLQQQNTELERQSKIKSNIAEVQKKAAASDAKVSQSKKSYSVANDIRNGGDGSKRSGYAADAAGTSTDAKAVSDDIKLIKEYQDEITKLENKQGKKGASDKNIDKWQKEIDEYNKSINTLSEDVSSKSENISKDLASMTDASGVALPNYTKKVTVLNDALNEVAHFDTSGMTSGEKVSNSIDKFFGKSSSNGIKDYLTSLAEANKLTESSISGLGLSSADFGDANLSDVIARFNEIAASAKEAAAEAEKVDGSLTGVATALESENSGDGFVKMKDYLDQSQSLSKQGLTGTDEFDSIEKMITNGTGKSYQEAYDSLQRYFTTNQNKDSEFFGQLTRDGVQNFADDFNSLGSQFETTGEAAKAMGISTEVFESAMGRLSDYDGFENVEASFEGMVKSSEKLASGKSALDGLKKVYDSLDENNKNKSVDGKLAGWEEQLAQYDNDISQLDPKVIAEIEFQYDLATLQQKIAEAEAIAKNSGASQDYASVLAGKTMYKSTAEKEAGFNTEGVTIPVEYTDANNTIVGLQEKLKGATEDQKVQIQAEISNIMDVQNNLLNAFNESECSVNINADSSMEEVNAAWDSFLATAEGQEIIAKISADGENAKQTIADLLGITPEEITIPITAEDQATEIIQSVEGTEIGEKLAAIIAQDGATPIVNLYNMLDADPKFSKLSAEDKASLVLQTYNGLDPEDKNSLISQTGGEATTGVAQAVASALSTIPSQVTTVITTVRETINKVLDVTEKGFANAGSAVDRKGAYNGTAHAQGTALSTGTILWYAYRNHTGQAYAGGNWGVQNDTDALINELGAEIIVSNGRWRIANNGYPTFANLKQGDIVFNHKQSEQLMKNGYVTGSHAKVKGALATGTVTGGKAFADGTDDKDEFKEEFDGIDILLERIDAAFKKLKDSIDDFSENLDLQNSTTQNAIDTARRDIGTMQSAYNAYIEKANAVGLEDNWKTAVQNGELKITEITDKDLKQRIDDYQDYYNKALSVSEEMADLQRELIELATQKLDNIDNYFSNRFDYNEDNGYETGIEELKSVLDKYTNELNAQVNSGAIKMYSDEWYDAMSKISEYMDNIFDATISRIESVITNIDNASKNFNNAIDLKEARSEDPTRDDYTQIINNNNKQIDEVNKKRQKALADMAIYDVNSDKYKELADEISNCDDEIYGLLESNEELKDSIFEAEFTKPIEKLKTQYENLTNELDDLRGLMNDDAFIDPKGMLTADGAANIALIAQGMAAAKQMTADYTGALSKLNGALESGLISQAEYDEQQNDILDSIRDSVGVTEDYKNELVDLYKKQMEAENDALHENIDARKDALQKKKEYYDYDKKVKGQSKEINILKAQAAALSGVTNAAGQAKLKAIQDEIKNAENDLSETKKDHAYEIRVEGLDTMGDEMDEALEKTLEEITYNADKQQQIVQEMLNKVVGMYGDAYGKINDIIKDTGWVQGGEASDNNDKLGSEDGAQDIVNDANKPQADVKPSDTVGDINVGGTPADNPKNDEIEEEIKIPIDITNRKVAQIKLTTSSVTIQEGQSASVGFTVRPTDAKNKAVKWSSSNTKVATVSGGKVVGISPGSASITCVAEDDGGAQATCGVTVTKKPAPPAPPVQSGGGDGVARVGDKVTLNAGQRYFYDSWGKTPAGSKYAGVQGGVVIDSYSGAEYGGGARNHGGYGVHIKSADGKYGDLGWVRLDQLSGYAKGTTGVKEDQFARINELGTEMLTRSVRINGRDYTHLSTGDGVVPANITKNLMDFGVNPQRALSNSIGSLPNRTSNNQVIVNYDNLINIEGNATPETVFEVKKMMPEIVDGVTRAIMGEVQKAK